VTEALEFLAVLPDDLSNQVEVTYQREFGAEEKPIVITDALKEYTSYLMYFVSLFNKKSKKATYFRKLLKTIMYGYGIRIVQRLSCPPKLMKRFGRVWIFAVEQNMI
jgi:hypothetical protein